MIDDPWRRGQRITHCRTGKTFEVVKYLPGGNMALDKLRLRSIRADGSRGKVVTRISEYYCPIRSSKRAR